MGIKVATPLQKLAAECNAYFERDKRNDGTEFWKRKESAPKWMQDMCRAAHGSMSPDDWRYELIVQALDRLADYDNPDAIEIEADIYNNQLLKWLSSHLERIGYCDEAMQNSGQPLELMEIIGLGQVLEKEEVLNLVRKFLEQHIEDTANG